MNKTLRIALCLGLCLLCALGCRGQAPDDAPREVLRFWHTFNAEEARTVESLLAQFEAENPGVRVEVTVLPFGSARHRLRAALGQGDGPALARAEVAWIPELASEGLLEDVTEHIQLEEHLPQARPFVRHQGRTWAWPQSVDCLVLYYNRALLEEIGEPPPADMDALLRVGRRLTVDKQGRDATVAEHDPAQVVRHGLYLKGDGYVFLPFLWAYGGRTLDPEARQVWIGEQASVEAAGHFRSLARDYGVVPGRLDFSNDYQEEITRFGEGRVAMIINGPWAAEALLQGPAFAKPENLGVAPVPRGPQGRGGSPVGGHGYVLARGASPRARALAAFLASARGQQELALRNHILPTRRLVYQAPQVSQDRLLVAFRQALEQAHQRAVFPGMARLFDALTPAVQKLLRGEGQPEVLMQAVAREWAQILGITAPAAAPAAPDTGGSSPPPAHP